MSKQASWLIDVATTVLNDSTTDKLEVDYAMRVLCNFLDSQIQEFNNQKVYVTTIFCFATYLARVMHVGEEELTSALRAVLDNKGMIADGQSVQGVP